MIKPTQQYLQSNVFLSLSVMCGPISCFLLHTPIGAIFFAASMIFLAIGFASGCWIEPFIKWDQLKTLCRLKIAWVICLFLYLARTIGAEDPVILWSSIVMVILCFIAFLGSVLTIAEYKESQEKLSNT